MPEWMFGGVVTFAGSLLVFGGVVVGHILSSRAQTRAAFVQAEANQKTAEQVMIDQLQEELAGHRKTANDRMTEQDARMTALEDRNERVARERDGYRDYAHELRSHIFDGRPPPPPNWPEGLPR